MPWIPVCRCTLILVGVVGLTGYARAQLPTAQDLRESFGLGDSGLGITIVDADGVALAAIQALIAENRRLQQRVEQLERKIERQP